MGWGGVGGMGWGGVGWGGKDEADEGKCCFMKLDQCQVYEYVC